MNTRITPSEFTPGAFWVWVEWVPEASKMSKSEKVSQWFLVSSWGSEVAALEACEIFRRF